MPTFTVYNLLLLSYTFAATLFNDSLPTLVANAVTNEVLPLELGVRFSAPRGGTIQAVRFYRGPSTNEACTVSIYTLQGALVRRQVGAAVTSSVTSWREIRFAQGLTVAPSQPFIATYFSRSGGRTGTGEFFRNAWRSQELVADGGWYGYISAPGFPNTGTSTNYWVDVVLTPAPTVPSSTTISNSTQASSPTTKTSSVPSVTSLSPTIGLQTANSPTTSSTATATTSTTAAQDESEVHDSGNNLGLWIGIAVGSFLFAVAVLATVLAFRRRNHRRAQSEPSQTVARGEDVPSVRNGYSQNISASSVNDNHNVYTSFREDEART